MVYHAVWQRGQEKYPPNIKQVVKVLLELFILQFNKKSSAEQKKTPEMKNHSFTHI